MVLDFKSVWNRQSLTKAVEYQLIQIAELMFGIIVAPEAGLQNVTEWCKQELCWIRARDTKIGLLRELGTELVDRDEERFVRKTAEEGQTIEAGIQTQATVFELGPAWWRALHSWGRQRQLLSPSDDSILSIAGLIPSKIPTEKQCARLLQIKTRLENEGYTPR
jgi:hypothetical protein